nr:MAG TPA: hypothetical protein [Caudoviricetes sp.]
MKCLRYIRFLASCSDSRITNSPQMQKLYSPFVKMTGN